MLGYSAILIISASYTASTCTSPLPPSFLFTYSLSMSAFGWWILYTVSIFLVFQSNCFISSSKSKSKGIPQQVEVAQGVPGRLRLRIFSTFGTTGVVSRQTNPPTAFSQGETPGTHFQRLSRPHGTWFCGKEPRKKSQVTPPGIDPGAARLVEQRLNHYAIPDPISSILQLLIPKLYLNTGTVNVPIAVILFLTFSSNFSIILNLLLYFCFNLSFICWCCTPSLSSISR